MDYLTYESFIHPDVLTAFLIKSENVVFEVTKNCSIGDEILPVDSVTNIYAGDKFLYNEIAYTVRTVDAIHGQVFVNPLEADIPEDTSLTIIKEDRRAALKNFYEVGQRDYSAFATTLANAGVPVRFDADVYILKVAFIAMYKWILHNKAFIRDINLTGIGIPKSQVYDHFLKLLQLEQEDLESLRKEAMDELARKQQNEADGKSGTGFVRFSAPNRGFFGGYHRGW